MGVRMLSRYFCVTTWAKRDIESVEYSKGSWLGNMPVSRVWDVFITVLTIYALMP